VFLGGGGTELENGGTTNTILSFLWYSPYGYSKKHPTHLILIDSLMPFYLEQPLVKNAVLNMTLKPFFHFNMCSANHKHALAKICCLQTS